MEYHFSHSIYVLCYQKSVCHNNHLDCRYVPLGTSRIYLMVRVTCRCAVTRLTAGWSFRASSAFLPPFSRIITSKSLGYSVAGLLRRSSVQFDTWNNRSLFELAICNWYFIYNTIITINFASAHAFVRVIFHVSPTHLLPIVDWPRYYFSLSDIFDFLNLCSGPMSVWAIKGKNPTGSFMV